MQVLSAAEMQACDLETTERFGIASSDLMRIGCLFRGRFRPRTVSQRAPDHRLCGRGNNGGDGMMAARQLSKSGLDVTTLLLGKPDKLAGDAAQAWLELSSAALASPAHGSIHIVATAEDLARHHAALETDLIIDAVLGTGFKPPLKGLALAACEWIKASSAPILSVDLPSGWPADETNASLNGPVFPSDAVIAFTAPKPAHVFGQLTRRWDQPVVVAPIGSPEAAIVSQLNLALGRLRSSARSIPAPCRGQQRQFRPCAGCGWFAGISRRKIRRAFHDFACRVASRSGAGHRGCSSAGVAASCRGRA